MHLAMRLTECVSRGCRLMSKVRLLRTPSRTPKQHGGSHYQKYKIQPSKFVVENELLYPEGCAIKYIIRHRDKGKKQDLLKAIHFIEMIIERDYSETDI